MFIFFFYFFFRNFLFPCKSGNYYHLLKTFTNSLEPDEDQQNVGPDLDPNALTLLYCSWKIFLKVDFEKS